jgi:AcrR family transcriptional regulator
MLGLIRSVLKKVHRPPLRLNGARICTLLIAHEQSRNAGGEGPSRTASDYIPLSPRPALRAKALALYFPSMAPTLAPNRIAERKLRDKQARRGLILSAARRVAELEGWSNVTVRRLSDEISYSQPVLYAHFGNRAEILDAVAIEGFQEIGLALEKARKRVRRGNAVKAVADAYLEFAASSPALYEVMFSLSLRVPFDDPATPPELRFAFSQLMELFQGQSSKPEVVSELFWANLHGIAELTRTKRFPRSRQKERVRALVELFTLPRSNGTGGESAECGDVA